MRGKALSKEDRAHVHYLHLTLNQSAQQIFASIFRSDPTLVSIDYLEDLCSCLRRDPSFAVVYLDGARQKTGREQLLGPMEQAMIVKLAVGHCEWNQRMMRDQFKQLYYNNAALHDISMSTISRVLQKADISRKVLERRHMRVNDVLGFEFLERMSMVDPIKLIDIDETASSPAAFFKKYGYAQTGDRAVTTQFVIGRKMYSTIAAATPLGFLCWEIYEGTISDEQFIEFIDTKVRPLCSPDSVCIIDNAKYHHTHAVRGYLEQVFNGQYAFSPAYSPHLKPVERAFSLVKTWLREHEEQATQDPVAWLNRAFEHFAIGGPGAGSLLGHWDEGDL
mmetsp:Transcript_14153/g.31249  ORF Transcript_14153/g.31249 Transcript_14153/m.31249 type:complete len:335 (+) Transcript_14153:85-1089(+)|eukprot:CAMPEP_0173184066 /NCGR_PEP_ID=MMETSP1141-20130122/8755_1 /TAXON_ID=483371 /ORGANISM="non described non described, Strain CCMP2298" /LENGTH=334 /DNA_ID=CAMNT_0014107367 /DNA_START=61 /DNA_END=1065 /DNA_ORIENTATION=-